MCQQFVVDVHTTWSEENILPTSGSKIFVGVRSPTSRSTVGGSEMGTWGWGWCASSCFPFTDNHITLQLQKFPWEINPVTNSLCCYIPAHHWAPRLVLNEQLSVRRRAILLIYPLSASRFGVALVCSKRMRQTFNQWSIKGHRGLTCFSIVATFMGKGIDSVIHIRERIYLNVWWESIRLGLLGEIICESVSKSIRLTRDCPLPPAAHVINISLQLSITCASVRHGRQISELFARGVRGVVCPLFAIIEAHGHCSARLMTLIKERWCSSNDMHFNGRWSVWMLTLEFPICCQCFRDLVYLDHM